MTNPSDRFPDNIRQHLIDAFVEYVRVSELSEQSDVSDLLALLHQLIEANVGVNRAMNAGVVLTQYLERVLGPPPAFAVRNPLPTDPTVEARYREDLARWEMQAVQIICQVFLKPIIGDHPIIDMLHNDADRGLAGNALHFFRAVGPKHGNKRDVLQRTARDAMVYTVILAAAELDDKDRYNRVLAKAGVYIGEFTFLDMRKNVEDKAALNRIDEEASRRRHNRRLREKAARRSSRGRAPQPEKPMAAALIAGSITEAEQLALFPERYQELAGLGTVEERIQYLFTWWSAGSG